MLQLKIARPTQPLTDAWQHMPVAPRGSTAIGISLRSPQLDVFELDGLRALETLLSYPFQIIRLGAYWNRMEPTRGRLSFRDLDWQVDAAERAGKQVILCVGAVKTFGYPELFVPAHHLPRPLEEGTLVTPDTHAALLAAATSFVTHVAERYRDRAGIVAWQVEEALQKLSDEHRAALVEVHYKSRPYHEVAHELGVPVGTIKSRVYYALKAMRLALEELGWSDDV